MQSQIHCLLEYETINHYQKLFYFFLCLDGWDGIETETTELKLPAHRIECTKCCHRVQQCNVDQLLSMWYVPIIPILIGILHGIKFNNCILLGHVTVSFWATSALSTLVQLEHKDSVCSEDMKADERICECQALFSFAMKYL